MNIVLAPARITFFLAIVLLRPALAHIAGLFSTFYLGYDSVLGLVPLFDFDQERNVPTLYSSSLLLFCSVLLLIIAVAKRKALQKHCNYWAALAAIFLFLSVDESLAVHERLSYPIRGILNTSGILYFAWVIPYGIATILFLMIFFRFLIALPAKTRMYLVVAGLIYIGGAIGLELAGSYYYELHKEEKNLTYAVIATLEELLEMVGALLFLFTLMSLINSEFNDLCVRISSSAETSSSSRHATR